MARQLRTEYEGAIYHVMNRGDRGEPIFRDEEDRWRFCRALGETCERAAWQVHAFCLMNNHFHAVIETPQPTLVAGMKWLLGTYTQRFNLRHQVRGHLFAGRYKSLLVDGSSDFYLRVVCDYVHLNPLRARLLPDGAPLETYPWSSYPYYLAVPGRRPAWLRTDRLLGEHGLKRDNARGRRNFAAIMGRRLREEGHAEEDLWPKIRRGWKFGADDFADRLVDLVKPAGRSASHTSEAITETMEAKGRRLIRQELERDGFELEALREMKKGAPWKIRLAETLRRETTLTVGWIAQELHAGVPQTLWKALTKRKKNGAETRD